MSRQFFGRRAATVLLSSPAWCCASCSPQTLCCGRFGTIIDSETMEPIVGAMVEWVETNEKELVGWTHEEYLDAFGRTIGFTNEHGYVMVPTCGTSEGLNFAQFRFTTVNDITLLRVHLEDRSEIVVMRSGREAVMIPSVIEVQSETFDVFVGGASCSGDSRVEDLIPSTERSGTSRVTVEIWSRPADAPPPSIEDVYWPNEPDGDLIAFAPVVFVTTTREALGDRTADDYLGEFGRAIGWTDFQGQKKIYVYTEVPAYAQCGSGFVNEVWLLRVAFAGSKHTVIMEPPEGAGPARFHDFTGRAFESDDGAITVYTPYADCLMEHGG